MSETKFAYPIDDKLAKPYRVAASAPQTASVHRSSLPIGTVLCLMAADVGALLVAVFLASVARNILTGKVPIAVLPLASTATIFALCSFTAARLYPCAGESPIDELRKTVLATSLAFLSLGASTFISHGSSESRLVVVLAYLFSCVFIPLARSSTRALFACRPWWGCPVVIIGMGTTGRHALKTLIDHPENGLRPVAVLDDGPFSYDAYHANVFTGRLADCFELTRSGRISYGIICKPELSKEELFALLDKYGQCFSQVLIIPDLVGMRSLGVVVREFGGIVGLEVSHCLLHPVSRFVKRGLDLLIALTLAPFLWPIVAFAALLLRIETKGPVFYADVRVGYGGKRFVAWKLRSMVVNGQEVLSRYLDEHPVERAVWRRTQKLKRDPRVTRIGRFLRRTSIDELPQFWNVLVGEMSVVGPRPFLPCQTEMYGQAFELYKKVRPGITGLWQISGRNHLSFEDRARLDSYGIRNWSVWLDVYILFRTIPTVLRANGAY